MRAMRHMRHSRLRIAIVLPLVAGAIAMAVIGFASAGDDNSLTAVTKSATGRFHNLSAAQAAGWNVLVKDKLGITCIDNQPVGGMGFHYANPKPLGDAVLDPTTPEALVYAPNAAGQPKLAALEYIVFADAWTAAGNTGPPQLFGQPYLFNPAREPFRSPALLGAPRLDLASESGRNVPALESAGALLAERRRGGPGLPVPPRACRDLPDDAADADDARAVRRASQPDDLNSCAGVRRVHHPPTADVDADVSEPGEEEQVAGLHPGSRDSPTVVVERVRAVRERDAQPCVRPVDEPRAVEAGRGRRLPSDTELRPP